MTPTQYLKFVTDPEQIEYIKQDIKNTIALNPGIAVVGRIESWLNNSESRYPVSCTVFEIEDSMEGPNGIEESWLFGSKALRYGAGVAFDLSKIRGKGSENGRGLTASGPVSFMEIFSSLNKILRRGGVYKNGAIVCYLEYNHPDIIEFLNANSSEYSWVKKAVYVDEDILKDENRSLLLSILDKVRDGTVWLAKKRWDAEGNRLFSQVCTEILLRSNSTCLLMHTNLGALTPAEVPLAMEQSMYALCRLHSITGAGKDNMYRTPEEDRQVGLGVIGFANFLAQNNVTYKQFVEKAEQVIQYKKEYNYDDLYTAVSYLNQYLISQDKVGYVDFESKAMELVYFILEGFYYASYVARSFDMDRAFTIAPTASCSYRYKDLNGYTTTPEISPPICHPVTKISTRDSGTFGAVDYQYPPTVETAEEVGWDIYYRLVKVWQTFMEDTGLAHAISFNVWNTCPVDLEWFKDWMESPLVTTYYRMMVQQDYVDKTTVAQGVSDEFLKNDFFSPVEEGEEDVEFFNFNFPASDIEQETPGSGFCPIGCESCAE